MFGEVQPGQADPHRAPATLEIALPANVTKGRCLIKPLLQDWYIKRWKFRNRGVTSAAYVEAVTGFIDRAIARQI